MENTVCYRVQEVRIDGSSLKTSVYIICEGAINPSRTTPPLLSSVRWRWCVWASLQVLGMGPALLPREILLGGRGKGQTPCMLSEALCGYFWVHTPVTDCSVLIYPDFMVALSLPWVLFPAGECYDLFLRASHTIADNQVCFYSPYLKGVFCTTAHKLRCTATPVQLIAYSC